jgi:hypothetical protein
VSPETRRWPIRPRSTDPVRRPPRRRKRPVHCMPSSPSSARRRTA